MSETSRRAVLAGGAGALAALAGCATYGDTPEPPVAQESAPVQESAPPKVPNSAISPPATPGEAPPPAGFAKVSEIPVGGGKVFAAQKVVLTQPTAGTIKAFSVVCTHAGCPVTEVAGGTINCPCHGSKFRIADGSVAGGPAPSPLPPVRVDVAGDSVSLA